MKTESEYYELDEEGTNEEMIYNGLTDEEIEKSCEQRSEIIELINLGVETSMRNVGGSYITSKGNAAYYKEVYGWQFSRNIITEL